LMLVLTTREHNSHGARLTPEFDTEFSIRFRIHLTNGERSMKSALFAACLTGVTLLSAAQTRAQGIAIGVPVYPAPVYAAPVYGAPVYPTTAYTTAYAMPGYAYTAAPAYYAAPTAVYAAPAPYAVAPSVVVGGPALVYGHWGRHHAHLYYRW
jgi:hypothetical protein